MRVEDNNDDSKPRLKSPNHTSANTNAGGSKFASAAIQRARDLTPDAPLLTLFCVWMVLQCFQYRQIPLLNWNLGLSLTPDRVLFGWILFIYVARPKASKSPEKKLNLGTAAGRVEQLMMLYGIIGLTSYVIVGSDAGNRALRFLTSLFNFPVWPCVAYFMARRLEYSRTMLTRVLRVLAVLCLYLSVTSICEHFFPRLVFPSYIMDPSIGIQFGRARGPFLSAVTNGGILLVTFAALACLASEWVGIKRLFALASFFLLLLAVYFTETRAIWLGFAAIMFTMVALRTSMRRNAILLGGLLFIGFFSGVGSKFSFSQQTLFSRRQGTVEYRYANYETTWNMFKDNWLFGVGYGRFLKEWDKYFPQGQFEVRELEDGNHSSSLGVLAELGIFGFLSYTGTIFYSFLISIRAYRQLDPERWRFEKRFALVGLAAIQVFFILGLTSDLRWDQMFDVIVFWLLGIVSSVHLKCLAADHNQELSTIPPSAKTTLKDSGSGRLTRRSIDKPAISPASVS